MTDRGPDYTVWREGRDVYGRPWVLARKRGGQMVRVVIPDRWATPQTVADTVAAVIASLPAPPGPNAY